MYGECHLLLFSCSVQELGWPDLEIGSDETREQLQRTLDSVVADIADRFSSGDSIEVTLFAGARSLQEVKPPVSSKVVVRDRLSSVLIADVAEAVREIYSTESSAPVVIFFGRNPLYPLDYLLKGVDLLLQEDDVVVIGQGYNGTGIARPMWLATKSYHPELFETRGMWWEKNEAFLQLTSSTQSLVMQMRAVRDIYSLRDLPIMLHDIEREILLRRWYPTRTHEALKRVQRLGIMSETTQ